MALKIGLQTAMLPGTYAEALDHFIVLQKQFSFSSAELQLESTLYTAHVTLPHDIVPEVEILGVHLPFMDLDPFSPRTEKCQYSRHILFNAIQAASEINADYVVFHARAPGTINKGILWAPFLSELAEKSQESGMTFCLENADDLYDIGQIHPILHELPKIKLCLDIGHLYEHTFNLFTRYLPLFYDKRLANALKELDKHIKCMHIHNHNGFYSHQLLTRGKIDFRPIRQIQSMDIPLIVESDYRREQAGTIEYDIRFLGELIA
jgi:endonuclease IV